MILISHRGNLHGKILSLENNPVYINTALKNGYNVEVDIWRIKKKWYLGHDEPQYQIKEDFFNQHGLWCHAKNIFALQQMTILGVHCFWHQTDDVALTSKNYLWTYPGKKLTFKSIAVLPEETDYSEADLRKCTGICSDYNRRRAWMF